MEHAALIRNEISSIVLIQFYDLLFPSIVVNRSIIMLLCRLFFCLVLFSASTVLAGIPTDRFSQRDKMSIEIYRAPKIIKLGDKADMMAKSYLTKMRERFANVLDKPWDSKYNNHKNVKQWIY